MTSSGVSRGLGGYTWKNKKKCKINITKVGWINSYKIKGKY